MFTFLLMLVENWKQKVLGIIMGLLRDNAFSAALNIQYLDNMYVVLCFEMKEKRVWGIKS